MIGDYKGVVKNKVVVALLQAYHDILDYDGMKSILKEAGMIYIKDIRDKNPNDTLDFFSFKKIISAQNCLLYDSSDLLFEIGKKFSFYLFPFGKSFKEIIEEVNISFREILLVGNRFNVKWEKKLSDFSDEIGVKFAGIIPDDQNIVEFNLKGKSLISLPKNSPAFIAVKNLFEKIRTSKLKF